MRILMINVVCGIRSTGRICADLACALEKRGHEVKIAFGREVVPPQYEKYAVRIGSDLGTKIHALKARLLDGCGFGSKKATLDFIEWVKKYDPDVIHLHNVHGYYINVDVLFNYLRTCGKRILWTLHDCWPFTGHAAYCEYSQCERWISGCERCPSLKEYPSSLTDRSRINWKKKRALFCGIPQMTLVTPSVWLESLVKKSFLSAYPTTVIHNGVDTAVFKPTPGKVQERYCLPEKKIVLGAAAVWDRRKGLDDFIKLAGLLPQDYQIVLVGLSKDQMKAIPSSIVGIERTNSVKDLVELYSAANVFVNLTYEDNYPTTNLESIACRTPVVTYDTGGSGESAVRYGIVVPKGRLDEVVKAILSVERILVRQPDTAEIGLNGFIEKYMELYES